MYLTSKERAANTNFERRRIFPFFPYKELGDFCISKGGELHKAGNERRGKHSDQSKIQHIYQSKSRKIEQMLQKTKKKRRTVQRNEINENETFVVRTNSSPANFSTKVNY